MLSEIFKSSYLRAHLPKESVAREETRPLEVEAVTIAPEAQIQAFPTIQPMRASLYFEGIEGFGEWPLHLSTRALKDLRDVKRSDGAMFQIVMKKLKYYNSVLSHNHR